LAIRYAATFRAQGDAIEVLKSWTADWSFDTNSSTIELRFASARERDAALQSIAAIDHKRPIAVFEIS